MNERSNSGMGATALVILVLSFLIPGWVARALGLSRSARASARLDDGAGRVVLPGPLAGLRPCSASASCSPSPWRSAARASRCCGDCGRSRRGRCAPAWRSPGCSAWRCSGWRKFWANWLWDVYATLVIRFAQWRYEQRELRRLYREEYAADFPSYRAFLRFYRAIENGEDPDAQRGGRHAWRPSRARSGRGCDPPAGPAREFHQRRPPTALSNADQGRPSRTWSARTNWRRS